MREKPLVERVDVVIGEKPNERLVTVPKATAARWPNVYTPATTDRDKPTAAARRAKDLRDAGPAPSTSAEDLPVAADTAAATASAAATAGTSGVTTEGVTS